MSLLGSRALARRPLRRLTVAVTAGLGCLAFLGSAPSADAQERELVVVQANVGNVNLTACREQVFKLCQRAVEARATTALRGIDPDIVGFQEILPPDLCRRAPSVSPFNLCSGPLEPPLQSERLLGPGYQHACDDRFGWDCLSVASRAGQLEGGLSTRPVLPECEDTGFTLNTATVRIGGEPVTVTVAHPDSMDDPCRAAQIRDLFENAIPPTGPVLILGDFNLDPFRENNESVRYWRSQVPSRFAYASTDEFTLLPGPSQSDPTGEVMDTGDATVPPPFGMRTIDFVLVRGLRGSCRVQRVDGGGGMDHRAQVCRISFGAAPVPAVSLGSRGCTVFARVSPSSPLLRGVRFRLGRRTVLDRRAPFELSRRGTERTQRVRVSAQAELAGGGGPRAARSFGACARPAGPPRRRPGPRPRRPQPRFTG